ncbi:hypothetical protein HZA87_04410 [Candidatus Uhrbacteria bacterium]|nr:hypothetical protein [Candidatus Uhrbacteria bacterium]
MERKRESPFDAIALLHEYATRWALRLVQGRQHLVDADPRRFQPTYICDGGG